ncbi:MAG: dihydroorotate dehydrogenase [Desulfitibacter sp. BRH_c19]|nr:MAG: dihydroorotate dehydrogenase [Desulfitibacter sp. BRH_c19]
MVNLKVKLGKLEIDNPVTVASGTYGFGLEYAEFYDPEKLGAIFTKGITYKPREGNPPPRLWETPSGILNSIGLENPGVEVFIKEYLPKIKDLTTAIIPNISGSTVEEYCMVASSLDGQEGIAALEINISCPNVKEGGMAFGSCPNVASNVVKEVRKVTDLPLIVKLSPNVTDIVSVAKAVEEQGADALSLINTLLGMAIDIRTGKPALGNVMGGLSGPAVKPVAVRMVWQVSQAVDIPIIGMGGISSWQDAIEFMLAGADVVCIGTGNFANPMIAVEVIEGIKRYCVERNINNASELTDRAWK